MSRWQPDTRERLERAALDLFTEHGFAETTVPQITARAGLTTRTFFRHFADKREVLFFRSADLQQLFVDTVTHAPEGTAPLDTVAAAVEAASEVLEERPAWSRERFAVISANPALQERELMKMASLTTGVAEALRGRGVGEPVASLTAEAGIAVFRVAFEVWIRATDGRDFRGVVRDSFAQLRAVTSGS